MGVAQAVEVEAGQADPLEEGWEPAAWSIGMDRLSVGLAEDQVVILVFFLIHEPELYLIFPVLPNIKRMSELNFLFLRKYLNILKLNIVFNQGVKSGAPFF